MQMPSSFVYTVENMNKIKFFEKNVKLGNKAVMEFRDSSWWHNKAIRELERIGIDFLFCRRTDSPKKTSDN